MKIQEKWRRDAFRRSAHKLNDNPVMIVSLARMLAEVWCYDGQALCIFGDGRMLLLDWSKLMRHVRRHL